MNGVAIMPAMLLLVVHLSAGALGMRPSINQVKADNEASLMATPGVVSVGIGRDDAGQNVIVVGVEHASEQMRAAIPQQLDGYPVKMQAMGRITPR